MASTVQPPIKCPKCAHRQYDELACVRCGLVFSLVPEGETPWEQVPPHQAGAAREAEGLWAQVVAAPEDEEAHAAYLRFVEEQGLLDLALQRYRHRVADHPDEALSSQSLQRLIDRATARAAAMLGVASANARRVERSGRLVYNILLVVSSAVLVYALFMGWRIVRGMGTGPF